MMALTSEEREKILNLMDQLDSNERQKKISSLEAFGNWLSNVASSIYSKVKDTLSSLWSSICNLFE